MAVAKDVRPDLDGLAGNPFDRKPSRVHGRIDVLDINPATGQVAD
jgi:hypothetical protein